MSIVARRYAQALLNLAVRDKSVEPVTTALDEMADALAGSPELQAYLTEPKVAQSTKEQMMATLLERAKVPELVGTFVRFVTRKGRGALLEDIRGEFRELADARMGRASAKVTVAGTLTAAQEKSLRERLGRLSGKEVRLQVQVDPSILGGVVARIGSTVWDSSLRNQLNRIQQSILQD